MIGDRLNAFQKFSYSIGHVLNDLCASMWFSYLLIYFHRVVLFNDSLAGYVMLLGQVADALATTFVGFESDKTERGFCNYGRRKVWHLFGIISVLLSFPFIYNLCIGCENTVNWAKFIYYAPFVVIFQFGWAATQISHLALIPELTPNENERVALNSLRYAFTVCSNIFVYVVAYLLLKYKNSSSQENNLSPEDAPKFMILTFIVCGVGLLFQIIFHIGIKENNNREEYQREQPSRNFVVQRNLDWRGYLKSFKFYQVGLLYMCTRLIVNVCQVYLPMYVTDTVVLDKTFIALVPLVTYLSGFVSSLSMRYLDKVLGRYVSIVIGLLFVGIFSVLMWFDSLIVNTKANAIVASVIFGAGGTIISVASLSITTDLIGDNTNSGAFVFGAMSFTDKLSNGLVVAALQQFSPCEIDVVTGTCKQFYKNIMTFLPVACGFVALITTISIGIQKRNTANALVNEEPDETTPILVKT